MHFIPWPTDGEWLCICFSLACSLIAFNPMTNRQWVTVHLFFLTMQSLCISSHDQQAVSDTAFVFLYHAVSLHFIPWPTVCEWHCICFSLPCSLISFHPMTNSMWVTLDLFFFAMQSHCMTNREWVTLHLFVFTMHSHGISSHDQQLVSDTAFVFIYHAVSLHVIPCPIGSEWHCICFSLPSSLIALHSIPWPTGCEWHYICFSLPCILITFHPMTNR